MLVRKTNTGRSRSCGDDPLLLQPQQPSELDAVLAKDKRRDVFGTLDGRSAVHVQQFAYVVGAVSMSIWSARENCVTAT